MFVFEWSDMTDMTVNTWCSREIILKLVYYFRLHANYYKWSLHMCMWWLLLISSRIEFEYLFLIILNRKTKNQQQQSSVISFEWQFLLLSKRITFPNDHQVNRVSVLINWLEFLEASTGKIHHNELTHLKIIYKTRSDTLIYNWYTYTRIYMPILNTHMSNAIGDILPTSTIIVHLFVPKLVVGVPYAITSISLWCIPPNDSCV